VAVTATAMMRAMPEPRRNIRNLYTTECGATLCLDTSAGSMTRATRSPTGPSTVTPPSRDAFVGTVYPHGTTTLAFTMTAAGTLELTLTDVAPGGPMLGLGVGSRPETGRGCRLTRQVETTAGASPQITAVTGVGEYCVDGHANSQAVTPCRSCMAYIL